MGIPRLSDAEVIAARTAYIAEESAKAIKNYITDLFYDFNGDDTEILHALYEAKTAPQLIEVQQRFKDLLEHHANAYAMRQWTEHGATPTLIALQDEIRGHGI